MIQSLSKFAFTFPFLHMLSAKTEYACLALLQLAAAYGEGKPVQVRRLASEGKIPEGFLVQILQQLKRVGLVTSTRGACGGYQIAQSPESLSLGEVIDLIEGPPSSGSNLSDPTPLAAALAEACEEASHMQCEALRRITLADLVDRSNTAAEAMWYI